MCQDNTNAELPLLLRTAMRDLSGRVTAWWKREGLGHTSEIRLNQGGSLEVQFSCSLYSELVEREFDEDPTLPEPERRARVLKQFEAVGFAVVNEPNVDPAVRDCDTSRATLQQLVAKTFPSGKVWQMESTCTRSGVFVLQSMTVLIRELADVYALPAPPAEG
jgi:hypothetical protein